MPRFRIETPITPEPVLACSLDAEQLAERRQEWLALASSAMMLEEVENGARFTLPHGADRAAVAALVEAESQCCAFLDITLSTGPGPMTLSVTGPDGAREIIGELIGA